MRNPQPRAALLYALLLVAPPAFALVWAAWQVVLWSLTSLGFDARALLGALFTAFTAVGGCLAAQDAGWFKTGR